MRGFKVGGRGESFERRKGSESTSIFIGNGGLITNSYAFDSALFEEARSGTSEGSARASAFASSNVRVSGSGFQRQLPG